MAGDRYDRFLGAAAGAAIGAVHGAGGEAQPEELGWLRRMFEGLATHGRLELDWFSASYLEWLAGAKRATPLQLAAGAAMGRGAAAAEAGRVAMEHASEPLGGSACLLTAIPIGLLHVGELRGVADDAAAAARLTHVDARAVAGCRASSMALAAVRVHDAHGARLGALTGALVGARLGWEALPEKTRSAPAVEATVATTRELWRRVFPGSGK